MPTRSPDDGERGLRAAGWSLVVSGSLFVVVVTYLYTVLLSSGLSFDMFDDARRLLTWSHDHLTRYLVLYLIYLAQQLALAAAPLLVLRFLPAPVRGGPFGRYLAASCGLLSVGLAITSTVLLIMITRTSGEQLASAADASTGLDVLLTNAVVADMAKGCRVISEVLIGIWLAWLGNSLRRSPGGIWWSPIAVVGVWTAVVGLWKLMDPTVEFEDWIGFVTGPAFVAAGVALLRTGRTGSAAPS